MRNYIIVASILGLAGYALLPSGSAESSIVHHTAPAMSLEPPTTGKQQSIKTESIKLNKNNLVFFRGEVNVLSAAKAQKELLEKDAALAKGEALYLVLDTPGGDIVAGQQLIDTAKGLRRPIHTITIFAASMGFCMAQQLGTRYITPSGKLMAHRAYVNGVGGQVPGEFITRAGMIYRDVARLEQENAFRMGLTHEDYSKLVVNEYWVTGGDAVVDNAADKLAYLSCDASLSGSHEETINTMFGPVTLTYSDCPAINGPINVGAGEERAVNLVKKYGRRAEKLLQE